MVACPFPTPAYEYDNVLTPRVRKCEFCSERTAKGQLPACVEACPRQVLTFRSRRKALDLAHQRIDAHPDRYVSHVYGEHEVGGTAWLYLSAVPFEKAGFLTLGPEAPPKLTEAIQHGVFKYWIAPGGWYAFLATMTWYTPRRNRAVAAAAMTEVDRPTPSQVFAFHNARVAQAAQDTDFGLLDSAVAVLDPPADDSPIDREQPDPPHHHP